MHPPIFLIGNPRSGTTLLRLMLNNHQNIVVPPECGFAVWWYDRYKEWDLTATHDDQRLDTFLRDLASSKKIETWNLNYQGLRDFIREAAPASYSELVASVYIYFGISRGRKFHRWGDKNNFHILWIERLNALFPNAKFIHIVRDGRDVACSYRKLASLRSSSPYAPKLPTEIEAIAREWANNIGAARTSFSKIGWEKVYEVRYEDLVMAPEVELRRICTFLDEPFDDRMLEYYHYNKKDRQEPTEFLAWKQKTVQEPTTSEIGKFRRELTPAQVATFEKYAKAILETYDYSPVT